MPSFFVSKEKPMIKLPALKRSRNEFEEAAFDMSDFEEASKQVEDSIAFPSIEWSFDDNDDDEEDYQMHPRKRSCQGFSRSQGALNLASIRDPSRCQQRRGSNGSLC